MDTRSTFSRVFLGIALGLVTGIVLNQVVGRDSGGESNNVLSGDVVATDPPDTPSCISPATGELLGYDCCKEAGYNTTHCCTEFPLECPDLGVFTHDCGFFGDADLVCGGRCPAGQECKTKPADSVSAASCSCKGWRLETCGESCVLGGDGSYTTQSDCERVSNDPLCEDTGFCSGPNDRLCGGGDLGPLVCCFKDRQHCGMVGDKETCVYNIRSSSSSSSSSQDLCCNASLECVPRI